MERTENRKTERVGGDEEKREKRGRRGRKREGR